ncbi:hypothetical protein VTI74DRAFT_6756 [Chaetomium olivicolor]
MDSAKIYDQVREHHSSASRITSVKYGETVAKSFGYSAEEFTNIPQDAKLGLSCGNPFAITSLKEGEAVIELGSGVGFDIFLAATKVGPSGRAIGIDMNDDMVARANRIKSSQPGPTSHISFIKTSIISVPLPDHAADCIISNCVINLVLHADKPAVSRKMHGMLKPGGRVAVSDILTKMPLPEKLREDMAMYVGCIAGTSEVQEYEGWLKGVGFGKVMVVDTGADLNVYLITGEDRERKELCCAPPAAPTAGASVASGCYDPTAAAAPAPVSGGCCPPTSSIPVPSGLLSEKTDLNEFVGSYKIFAVKAGVAEK